MKPADFKRSVEARLHVLSVCGNRNVEQLLLTGGHVYTSRGKSVSVHVCARRLVDSQNAVSHGSSSVLILNPHLVKTGPNDQKTHLIKLCN